MTSYQLRDADLCISTGCLGSVRFAREQERPFLGPCSGFQHALIEYACNVSDLAEVDHAESNLNEGACDRTAFVLVGWR
jgi:CTP synthase (UTP-ammonia lyase)